MMVPYQRGFTLIELMIVIAIVSILAAIALPLYQDHVARSQIAEAMLGAGQVKTSITEHYTANGNWPQDSLYGDTVGGRYTSGVTHDGAGIITVTMRDSAPVNTRIRNHTLQLSPDMGGSAGTDIVGWTCSADTPETKYIPSGCQ